MGILIQLLGIGIGGFLSCLLGEFGMYFGVGIILFFLFQDPNDLNFLKKEEVS